STGLACVEAAIADPQTLIELEDEFGIGSPVGLLPERTDGHGCALRREHETALGLARRLQGYEDAVELHGALSGVLRGPEDRIGFPAAVEDAARAGPEDL